MSGPSASYIAYIDRVELHSGRGIYEVRATSRSQVGHMIVEHAVETFLPLGGPQPLIGTKVTIQIYAEEES